MLNKIFRKSERGQAIILIAFAIVGLIAIIGLMIDSGVYFIEYARLKRGVDAAAVSAALQFRQGFTQQQLTDAAHEFLLLNQSDVFDVHIAVCDTLHPDPADPILCPTPFRKLVRVTASRHVNFGFLRVIGWDHTDITASSVGEAASVDMVLVIDTSGSMSYETDGDPNLSAGDDPAACNPAGTCQPMQTVKQTALDFLDTLYFPYDRVAVVALTGQTPGASRNPVTVLHLSSNETAVRDAIAGLQVYQPPACDTATGSCLKYDASGIFETIYCPVRFLAPDYDPSSCTSSNVGGAMLLAGSEFAGGTYGGVTVQKREDSLWIVIALVGGPANASDPVSPNDDHTGHNVFGHCPRSTWPDDPLNTTRNNADPATKNPTCRDALASTRHCVNYPSNPEITQACVAAGGVLDPVINVNNNYDADDYARDWSDFVADPVNGQGATIFTIGLGDLVEHAPSGQPDGAEQLLQYMARQAGDQNSQHVTVNHGEYYFSPDASGLAAIFQKIADNIFTRISQ